MNEDKLDYDEKELNKLIEKRYTEEPFLSTESQKQKKKKKKIFAYEILIKIKKNHK